MLFYPCAYADCAVQTLYVHSIFNPDIIQLENSFRAALGNNKTVVAYTKVPRGLIVSIEESMLFNKGSVQIRQDGYKILDCFVAVLSQFDNRCVVESHTEENFSENSEYKEDWEISIRRANAISDYLVNKGKLAQERIFPLGFGEFMPYKETVSKIGFFDNRIDFVIIDYDYKR